MIEKLQEMFHKTCPFDFTRILVVGVSGGPDSLCLLDMLHRLGLRVVAAHLNHRLRDEAELDAEHVRRIAESYPVPCIIQEEAVGLYAREHTISVEEAARIVRYRFLFGEAARLNAQAVVVGHTADDQVETVLMHLLRGAGLEGLKGMEAWQQPNAWSQEVALARPLLGMWRRETVAYCRERGLEPVLDLSNLEKTYFRNRLRHELMPILEAYSPRLKEKFLRMTQVLKGDLEIIEPVVQAVWDRCIHRVGDGYVSFWMKVFSEQPVGVRRRLLRTAMEKLRPGIRDMSFETIERGLDFLGQPAPKGQIDLISGLRLFVEAGEVWISTWEADCPQGEWPQVLRETEVVRVTVDWSIALAGGWKLKAEKIHPTEEMKQMIFENRNLYHAWLDADQIPWEVEVRGRKTGDFIRPLGMKGQRVKITDLMINLKMPKRARRKWPLVCQAGEVIWIPGYMISHTWRVRPETTHILHLWLEWSA